jgi:hypothetical protein
MKKYRPHIHPNACRKLARFFRQVKRETGTWNIRETARRLGVNQKYVQENLIAGIEPTNPDIRELILLPRKPKKRFGDCSQCGKPVELTIKGELQSHVRPDGTYCEGSFTREFLPRRRLPKLKPKPEPITPEWWDELRKRATKAMVRRTNDAVVRRRQP